MRRFPGRSRCGGFPTVRPRSRDDALTQYAPPGSHVTMAGGLTRVLRAPAGPAEAYLRMAAAVGEDVAGALVPGRERDSFLMRDPRYIERTLPALRMTSELYFRADVRGVERI